MAQGVLANAAHTTLILRTVNQCLGEPRMILLGDTQEIGNHEHGERVAKFADELPVAVGEKCVELAVGQAPHEFLVALQAFRGDQSQK